MTTTDSDVTNPGQGENLRRRYRFVLPPSRFVGERAFVNPYLLELAKYDDRIFLFEDFGADRDRVRALIDSFSETVVEIGSGSGGHLVERAAASRDVLHLGFELRYKRAVKTLEKAQKTDLRNVVVLLIDGKALAEIVPADSCSTVYVNFPDPWERKKWRKNRMVSEDFLRTLEAVLKPDGVFSFKTDHAEYFRSSASLVQSYPGLALEALSNDLHKSEWREGNIETEFEKLFRSQSLPIHYLLARKRALNA